MKSIGTIVHDCRITRGKYYTQFGDNCEFGFADFSGFCGRHPGARC
jgi:hypothetical protein